VTGTDSPAPCIEIRGAREHNLRDLHLRIPRDRLVVITGLSGSGKSSLAFDTLYAEGQRRYVESLSAYARQFLDRLPKPDVDSIEGLSPAIAIEQKGVSRSPRSTVGTATEIHDHLRLLFARVGRPHCPRCGKPISSRTIEQMTDAVLALPEGTRLQILAPVVRDRKGAFEAELASFARQGFVRARIDGAVREIEDAPALAKGRRHTLELVVDRLAVRPGARSRVAESLETACRMASGLALLDVGPGEREELLSERNACPDCGVSYPAQEPRSFSFNSPHGACPECTGLGAKRAFDPERVVPDPKRPLLRAIAPWSGRRTGRWTTALLDAAARHYGVSLDTPWRELPKAVREGLLHGGEDPRVEVQLPRAGREESFPKRWRGVLRELDHRFETGSDAEREELLRYTRETPCPECEGTRLRVEARSVRVGGRSLPEVAALPVGEAADFLEGLALPPAEAAVAERVAREAVQRLRFLEEVGLGYLTLGRASATLSGGEGQRIRLATQIGARLVGVLYVLDEPSIGLHPRDEERLLASLRVLRDRGNTVVVVEHDAAAIRAADWVLDLGPGAGVHGGALVAEGPPAAIEADPDSLTGAYLSGRRRIEPPRARRRADGPALVLTGCREHNLKGIDVRIPLGTFCAVTGVSGSGKSTLVFDTLHRALAARLQRARELPGRFDRLLGLEHVDKVVHVSQAPIGRTPRSNPATYTGVFDGVRRVLSQVPEARVRGYDPGRFSFNVKGGRCETCQGDGVLRIEMHFLPDVWVTCDACDGRRYNRETLEILYKGRSIADVLAMTVEEAAAFFENVPAVRRPLDTLSLVGLGYLRLGQHAPTLSGGEAQRLKLARELARRGTGRTVYLLDEPTTGLHFADVEQLLSVLFRLVDRGHTVVVVEHHLDVVRCADYVIDLGPEGGAGGGALVAEGTPEAVAANPASHTGRALAPLLRAPDAP